MIQVRPAKSSDFDAVMAIAPNLYNGADPVPIMFHTYLSDPKAHPFVAEVDGTVVSFGNYYVVENGESVVATGLRSSPEHRNKGLITRLKEASLKATKENFPHIKHEVCIVCDSPFYDQYSVGNRKNVQVMQKQTFLQFLTSPHKLFQWLDNQRNNEEEDIGSFCFIKDKLIPSAEKFMRSLYSPEDYFIVGIPWLPLKVTQRNIEFASEHSNVAVTFDKSGNQNKVIGVSFASFEKVKAGMYLIIFFHMSTLDDMVKHLKIHLQQSQVLGFGMERSTILELMFPLSISSGEVKEMFSSVLGQSVSYNSDFRECILVLERPV